MANIISDLMVSVSGLLMPVAEDRRQDRGGANGCNES